MKMLLGSLREVVPGGAPQLRASSCAPAPTAPGSGGPLAMSYCETNVTPSRRRGAS